MGFSVSNKPLVGEYTFVLESDPAIDREAEGWEDQYKLYLDTGEEKHLPLKAGQKPTRWKFRNLECKQYQMLHSIQSPLWEMSDFQRQHSSAVVFYEYCKSALIGWDLKLEEGGDAQFRTSYDADQGANVASDESMATLQRIDKNLPVSLGFAAWRRTYLPPKS